MYGGGVDDSAEGADRVGAVYDVAADGGVLHDGGCDHNDIVGGASQLLDDQVDHLPESRILVLKKLRDSEEEGGGFLSSPALTSEEQQGKLGQDLSSLAHACSFHTPWRHTTLHFRGDIGL